MNAFRSLHSSPFVLPEAWNAESARLLGLIGFEAISLVIGGRRPGDERRRLGAIIDSVSVPVNVELPGTPGIELVGIALEAGAAGLSVAASGGRASLEQVSKTIADAGADVVLTATIHWPGGPRPDSEAFAQLRRCVEAGADVVYATGLDNLTDMARVAVELDDTPLAVLVDWASYLTVGDLARRGVRRVHLGASLARIGWGAILDAARHVREQGSFSRLGGQGAFRHLASGW